MKRLHRYKDSPKKLLHKISENEYFTAVVHAEKYQSRNWIAKYLVNNFMKEILQVVIRIGSIDVHEIGCGEGQLLGMLAHNNFNVRGCDRSKESLAVAAKEAKKDGLHIPLTVKSIYNLDPKIDSADTVLCCEVLEHLYDPIKALKKLLSITRRDLVLSVPREPIWHIFNIVRGRYVYSLGNTPGHIQHWTKKMFMTMVCHYADIIDVRTPLPWTIIHCRPRNG